MKIEIAKQAGFCEGVERAYRIAINSAKAGRPVFMLGNLVHNQPVVERLKNYGVKTISAISSIPPQTNGILLISAHGVEPAVYQEAAKLKLEILDTTCPWVKQAQKIAQQLKAEGRRVIIFGDKGHPEVKGLIGWSGGEGRVVESEEEIAALQLDPEEKIGILSQTTQAADRFARVVSALKAQVKDMIEYNTICGATSKRQNAAMELAKRVDLMLVVGDKMSANTKRLTELCGLTGTETHQIQTVNELNQQWLEGKAKAGITAGASTPEWIINDVISALKALPSSLNSTF
jgi:4-hydroxy-3-methylbut-2-enyl diphosphate reductase